MEDINKQIEQVKKMLDEKDLSTYVYNADKLSVIAVAIDWGDWKHEHAYCDYLMKEAGYRFIGEEVTEEDGSDCYSATHYYIKNK